MGEIKGQWLEEEQKLEILAIVAQAKQEGLTISRTSLFVQLAKYLWPVRPKFRSGMAVQLESRGGMFVCLARLYDRPQRRMVVLGHRTVHQFYHAVHELGEYLPVRFVEVCTIFLFQCFC